MESSKKLYTFKRIINILGNILIALLLLISLVLLYFTLSNRSKNQPPTIGGYSMYIVLSGSMNPTFNTGSLIIDKKTAVGDIKVNDIITFKDEDSKEATTHRVVGIRKESSTVLYTTKGDANEVKDPREVPYEKVLGVMKVSIPMVGSIMAKLRGRNGLIIMAILIGGFLIISESSKILKLLKKKN